MSKKNTENKDDSLATSEGHTLSKAQDDRASLAQILGALVVPGEVAGSTEWKVGISGGADHYWPAEPGMMLRGELLTVDERKTNLMVDGKLANARFYTVQLTAPTIGMTSDGEMVEMQPGMLISVLERTMLRKLEADIGKEILLTCDGKGTTKRGLALWKYRSWSKVIKEDEERPTVDTTGVSQ